MKKERNIFMTKPGDLPTIKKTIHELAKETYLKLDKIRKQIEPHTILSRSQTLNILVNKEEKRLNGKAEK